MKRTIALYKRFFALKEYEAKQLPKRAQRVASRAKLALVTPWALLLRYFRRNPRLLIWFAVWFVLVSCEVWFPYLMGVITWGTDMSKWWFSIGSACWIFWAGPGTPFLAIVLALTITTEAIYQKIKNRRKRK